MNFKIEYVFKIVATKPKIFSTIDTITRIYYTTLCSFVNNKTFENYYYNHNFWKNIFKKGY